MDDMGKMNVFGWSICVAVSSINYIYYRLLGGGFIFCYVHPYLGKMSNLTVYNFCFLYFLHK